MGDPVEIVGAGLRARIDPLGAELVSLRDADGRELMTDADPAFWTGHAPLLFPVVGRLNGDVLRIDGAEYPMKQHGFARRSTFALVEHDVAHATFLLEDSAETLAVYPRAFALRVTYAITDATLSITAEITNRETERSLPASFGFHPAFAWPLPYGHPRGDHRIVFEADEPATLRALNGSLTAGERPSPLNGRTLTLDDALFAEDALIWDRLASRSLCYGATNGPQLRIDFPDTPYLGIWSKPVLSNAAGGVEGPGAAFVCIEPWHGHADPVGFAGDLAEKPGIFTLAPGETKRIAMHVTLVERMSPDA